MDTRESADLVNLHASRLHGWVVEQIGEAVLIGLAAALVIGLAAAVITGELGEVTYLAAGGAGLLGLGATLAFSSAPIPDVDQQATE